MTQIFTEKKAITRFEDIIAWQKAKILSLQIYQNFSESRDYGFRDQIQRASVSAMNNIAEGFERHSDREFRQFLIIARGSIGEVRSMLELAIELEYIDAAQGRELQDVTREVSQLLTGFIKSLAVRTTGDGRRVTK